MMSVQEIAASLGSDIPFFLHGSPARCTGRGEIVTPAPAPVDKSQRILLLKPHFPVSTLDAYRNALASATRVVPGIPMGVQTVGGLQLLNDLECPVFAKHRFLAELKLWLIERPETQSALMSGSGSTVFAFLRPGVDAEAVASAARHELDATLWSWHGELSE